MTKPKTKTGLENLSGEVAGTITRAEYLALRDTPEAEIHVVLHQPKPKGE